MLTQLWRIQIVCDILHGNNSVVSTGIGHLREIKGTTSLKSDVPLQYFNWDEFDFMKPPLNKVRIEYEQLLCCTDC